MASTIEPPQTRREAENKRKEKKETSAICIPEPRKHQTRPWKAQHRIKTILNWIPFIWNSLQVRRRCLQIRETIIHPNTTSYGARTQGFLHENDERERKRERESREREGSFRWVFPTGMSMGSNLKMATVGSEWTVAAIGLDFLKAHFSGLMCWFVLKALFGI